jgi:hypothetical protein
MSLRHQGPHAVPRVDQCMSLYRERLGREYYVLGGAQVAVLLCLDLCIFSNDYSSHKSVS